MLRPPHLPVRQGSDGAGAVLVREASDDDGAVRGGYQPHAYCLLQIPPRRGVTFTVEILQQVSSR